MRLDAKDRVVVGGGGHVSDVLDVACDSSACVAGNSLTSFATLSSSSLASRVTLILTSMLLTFLPQLDANIFLQHMVAKIR